MTNFVFPSDFYSTPLGAAVRSAGVHAQLVAAYLASNEAATAIGVYPFAPGRIATALGLTLPEVCAAVAALAQAGYVLVDHDYNLLFVAEMAAWNLGVLTSERDKRVKSVRKQFQAIPTACKVREAFAQRYTKDLLLEVEPAPATPAAEPSAPSKTIVLTTDNAFADDPMPGEVDTAQADYLAAVRSLLDLRGMLRDQFPADGDEAVRAGAARIRDAGGAKIATEYLAWAQRENDLNLTRTLSLVFPADRPTTPAYDDSDI